MVTEHKTCDYKFMTSNKSGTYERFKKKYKLLTGKNPPPIDSWEFTGGATGGLPTTTTFLPKGGMPKQRWVFGKHENFVYHESTPIVGIFIVVRPYLPRNLHSAHAISAVKYNNTLFAFKKKNQMDLAN